MLRHRPSPFVPVPTAVFLVQADEHDWILVDTGPTTAAWQSSFRAAIKDKLQAPEDKLRLVLRMPCCATVSDVHTVTHKP